MTQSYNTGKSSSKMAKTEYLFPNELDKENVFYEKTKLDTDNSLYENNSPTLRCLLADPNYSSEDSGCNLFESKSSSPKSSRFSFGSMVSMEEILDLSELETKEEPTKLSSDFNKLITGNVSEIKSPEFIIRKPQFCRSFFRNKIKNSISTSVKTCSLKTDLVCPVNAKKRKIDHDSIMPILERSQSTNEASIKSAMQRSSTEPDLIGDFSKTYCLPIIPGQHPDLKSITPTTLVELMRGKYSNTIASFKVIDCRYPYEYEGGHITKAQNIYTKQQIQEELLTTNDDNENRHVLVFHCEFSSRRAPNLSRYLRNIDRNLNKDMYPYLQYPEVYLLDGGYKNFYENYSELCVPNAYLPMLHPDHKRNLRHFRTNSWMKKSIKKF